MPSKQKQVHTATFSGGMVTSLAPELRSSDTYEYMLNCVVLSSGEGNVGIVQNAKGNTLVQTDLPDGENFLIGYAPDEESNRFYYAIWNSNGFHTWYEFDSLERKISIVLQSKTDTNSIDILNFQRDNLILHADVVKNELLYWVDGYNNARKFNIKKAKDKSTTGYGINIRLDYINAYKKTSALAPIPQYGSDTTKSFNRLYGKLFKFAQRFIYDDGEKSNWSDYSVVALPDNEPITGISAIPSNNNVLKITIETGSPIVKNIEIAMQATDNSLTDGGFLNYALIANLDKKVLGISNDSTWVYSFYNDSYYTVTDPEKIIRPYSFIPRKPLCQNIVKNALVYWNGYEGFPDVPLNIEVDIDYEDLFLESGVENEINEPTFISTFHDVAWVGGKSPRETYETLSIGSDVKKGNHFFLNLVAPTLSFLSVRWEYIANSYDTAQTVANYFRNRVNEWEPTKDGSTTIVSVDGGGVASFSYTIKSTEYFDAKPDAYGSSFNSLKDTGESVNNIKLGSSVKFGIIYEDEDGRKSLTYTRDGYIVNVKTINELGGLQKPVITLEIKHQPPVWAKYYQIVRSPDLVYENYIQILIQAVVDVQATDDTEYLDLVVGSLFTYQKLHENTVLQYSFKKGDRLRLISWIDPEEEPTDPAYKTFYDFFETEILSYKETTETVKNETIATTVGSNLVTIEGTTNADYIGTNILIDGVERTIAAIDSGTVYQLNANMTEAKTFLNYTIIDRRGVIRIRKPSTDIIAEVKDNSIVEIYEPANNNTSTDIKSFFEFGVKFPIIDWGTDTRAHAGLSQNQDGANSSTLLSTPAIIKIDNGTAYVRNREFPITNNVPGAQVIVDSIEDAGYSDFYQSEFNNNGRISVQDTGDGEVHFGSRARYSNNYIEDTRINGLNDFDNLDREDYNDAYGDIKRTFFKENRVYVFKSLRDAWTGVGQNIITQADGTPLVGLSSKLLNDLQYFEYEGGIGDNPESLHVNANWIYHVMPNAGVFIRLGGNGVVPISEIYHLDNEVKEQLSEAKKYGARIYGGFHRALGLSITAIENYNKSIFKDGFSESKWRMFDTEVSATYEVVTPPAHGDVTFPNSTQWVYTPDTNYVGTDTFSYRAFIGGVWSDPENVCLTIDENASTDTYWRVKASSLFCVTEDGFNTGYQGGTILEQYYLGTGELTGEEKDNDPLDSDYKEPVYNIVACELPDTVPDAFAFTDQTGLELSTITESNTITVAGINIPVLVEIASGEYSKNGGAYTSLDGTAALGDTFKVRVTTSGSYLTGVDTTLTIGGVSDTFTATTKVSDAVPIAWSNTEAVDMDSDIEFYVNSVLIDTETSTGSGVFNGAFDGDTVEIRQVATVSWTDTGKATLTRSINGDFQQKSTDTYATTLNSYTFVVATGDDIVVSARTEPTADLLLSALVVDIINRPDLNVIGFIDNAEVTGNHIAVYTGQNFLPIGVAESNDPDTGLPYATPRYNNAYILGSDRITPAGSGDLDWRFEFNLAKLINDYPATDVFTIYLKGRNDVPGTINMPYSLKGASSSLQMTGGVGTYAPGIANDTNILSDTANPGVVDGANGSYLEGDLTNIIRFVYTVSTNSLVVTTY